MNARSAPSSVLSASAFSAASRKRLYCAGSSGLGFEGISAPLSPPATTVRGSTWSSFFSNCQFFSAIAAMVSIKALALNSLIEERFSTYLVAICTYAMRWFTATGVCLYRVSHHIWGESHKFIPFFLCLPCFKIAYTFFKCAYFLQQRRLVCMGRHCAALGGQDLSVNFPQLLPKFDEIAGLYQFLKSLARRVQGGHDVV